MCEKVEELRKRIGSAVVHNLRHEALIANPEATLKELCQFLGVEGSQDYYQDCAGIIYKAPHKSRFEVSWSRELIDTVKDKMGQVSFLRGYSYEDPLALTGDA
jgi:hypothetical protein